MTNILFFFLFVCIPRPFTDTVSWHTEFEKAQEEARLTEKPILLVFSGSDWCKPCIRLKQEVFETQEFNSYAAQHLSLLNVDFPRRRKNKVAGDIQQYRNTLAEKYNPKGIFPRVLLLDKTGKVQQELVYKGGGWQSFQQGLAL